MSKNDTNSITNVIAENKRLNNELQNAQREVEELRRLQSNLRDLRQNLHGQHVS